MSSSIISARSINDFGWLLIRSPWLVIYILCFTAPAVIFSILDVSFEFVLIAALIERALQLLVIADILKFGAKFLPQPRTLTISSRFIAFGFAIELAITAGTFLMIALPGIGSAIAAVALFLLIRSFTSVLLYPMPFMDQRLSNREAFDSAKALTAQVPIGALVIWPAAFFLLSSGLAFSTFPDGRLWWSNPVAHAMAGIAHLIFVYRATAASLLATGVTVPGHARPRFGSPTILLISGIVLWGANFLRAYTLPPGPSIEVVSAVVNERIVRITIDAKDTEYEFRGFTPQRFFVGGATGYPVSGSPQRIDDGKSNDQSDSHNRSDQTPPNSKRIVLELKSERSADELTAIEDLHLWYGAVKIAHLKIAKEQ